MYTLLCSLTTSYDISNLRVSLCSAASVGFKPARVTYPRKEDLGHSPMGNCFLLDEPYDIASIWPFLSYKN